MTLARPVVAVFALAVVLAPACGGGGGSSSTPSSPTSPSNPTTPVTGSACGAIAGFLTTPQTIVNGIDCTTQTGQTYAWSVVKLLMRNSAGDRTICSSVVIDDTWVLTAAHCLVPDITQVQADLGPGPLVEASEFHASPRYSGTGASSLDVGVVRFSQSLGHKAVPLLLSRDAIRGEQAVIAGYGQSATGSVGILRAAFVTISDLADAYLVVTASAPTDSAVCQGDSGGPLLISQGGEWAVAGIASSATGCVVGTSYFARVNNSDISAFILGYVPHAGQR